MAFISLGSLDLVDGIIIDRDISVTEREVILTDEFDHFSQLCEPCVGYSKNEDVTYPQK